MPAYTITELAPPPGGPGPNVLAWDINGQGNVAGGWGQGWTSAPMVLRAVQWDATVPHPIGVSSQEASLGTAINDAGEIVGFHSYFSAFLYSGGQVQDLSQVLGPDLSYAADINDGGIVVGSVGDVLTPTRAFVYDSKGGSPPILLDPLPGYDRSAACAINEAGQVAGLSWSAKTEITHLFLFENEVMRDLGAVDAEDVRLNDSGVITGTLSGNAFRLDSSAVNPVFEKLAPLPGQSWSLGSGINNDGVVVGQYTNHQGGTRAFVNFPSSNPEPGSFVLEELVTNLDDWLLSWAHRINNNGEIVGLGTQRNDPNQQTRAFLLTPHLPEVGLDRIGGLLAAFVMMFGGAPWGGPGWGITFGGGFHRIPPHEPLVSVCKRLLPLWNRLSQSERDLLLSSVVRKLTLLTDSSANKRLLEQTGRAIAKGAIEELGRGK